MARTKISEFSATPGDNTDIDGIDIAEGCAPSGINNAIRELMAQLKDMQTGTSGDTFTLTTVNSTTVDTTNLEATNLKAKDGTAAGSIANTTGVVTLASSVLTTTDINGGTVDGTTIGASSASTGAFTTLASNGATTFTAGTASTSTTTGTAVITGGLGVSGRINAANFDGIVGANTAAAVSSTNLAYTGTLTGGTGVINIGSGQVAKDASGNVTFGAAVNVGGGNISPQTGFKNRIINGAMTIDQRNAGASVTPTNTQFSVDRWGAVMTTGSKYSLQQNAGSVTPPVGFTNYLGATSLSAYSVASGDAFAVVQGIEGFNVADLGWGTANAQTVTLSFWVRSSLTGAFGGSLYNGTANRSYPFTFTISVANTWEQKTITVAGDTTGTWATDSNGGIYVRFSLGAGATFSGTANVWTAGNLVQPTGSVSLVGTSGATFYITGVQLEKGSTATPFEFRSIGTELGLCQRYYWRSGNGGIFNTLGSSVVASSTSAQGFALKTPMTMRAIPTVSISNLRVFDGTTVASISSILAAWSSTDVLALDFTTASGLVTGRNAVVQHNNSATAYIDASSEL
jgi:hypothetical protein